MHHKRHRTKNQRAGCSCGGKAAKKNRCQGVKWSTLKRAKVETPSRSGHHDRLGGWG